MFVVCPRVTRIAINTALFQQVIPPTGLVCLDREIQLSKLLPDFLWRVGFLSPLFGGQSKALMWSLGADKISTEGCVFAHYWKQFRKHMASDHWWALFVSSDCTGNGAGTYRKHRTSKIHDELFSAHSVWVYTGKNYASSDCKQFANPRPEVNQKQAESSRSS